MDRREAGGTCDLPAAGLTIANYQSCTEFSDKIKKWLSDLHCDLIFLCFVAIGACNPAAICPALFNLQLRDPTEHGQSRAAQAMGAVLAGDVIWQVTMEWLQF